MIDNVYLNGTLRKFYEKAESRSQALLLGLAIGDALGVPVEGKKRGSYRIDKMEGYGTHNQSPGTWSDDTSLALALADALLVDDLNLKGIARRFEAWREGKMFTPHGKAFGIGNTTAKAIDRLKQGIAPDKAGGKNENDNGNGSLMRIAPLALYLCNEERDERRYSITKKVSGITHAHPISVTACFIYIELLRLLVWVHSKEAAYVRLKADFACSRKFLDNSALLKFDRLLKDDIARLPEAEIKSSGYVVDTLEAAFWSFLTTSNYRDATLRAVNLGDDTDTVGAVTGALAGLYYGLENIPQEWLKTLAKREEIGRIAAKMPCRAADAASAAFHLGIGTVKTRKGGSKKKSA